VGVDSIFLFTENHFAACSHIGGNGWYSSSTNLENNQRLGFTDTGKYHYTNAWQIVIDFHPPGKFYDIVKIFMGNNCFAFFVVLFVFILPA